MLYLTAPDRNRRDASPTSLVFGHAGTARRIGPFSGDIGFAVILTRRIARMTKFRFKKMRIVMPNFSGDDRRRRLWPIWALRSWATLRPRPSIVRSAAEKKKKMARRPAPAAWLCAWRGPCCPGSWYAPALPGGAFFFGTALLRPRRLACAYQQSPRGAVVRDCCRFPAALRLPRETATTRPFATRLFGVLFWRS